MSESQTTAETTVHDVTSAPTTAGHPHILVADPNERTRDRRGSELRGSGYHVTLARTAFEAIVKACCHLPDLVVIDASLGDTEVKETTRLLATCPVTAHTPVVRLASGRRVTERVLTRLQRALA